MGHREVYIDLEGTPIVLTVCQADTLIACRFDRRRQEELAHAQGVTVQAIRQRIRRARRAAQAQGLELPPHQRKLPKPNARAKSLFAHSWDRKCRQWVQTPAHFPSALAHPYS